MDKNYTTKRINEIATVFIKHGFKNGIGNPKQLRLALEELGPTFIKIGQILSTRPDLISMEYISELEKLQDNVKPEEFHVMKKIIESELKDSIDNIFEYFNEKPIASASISEVFLAKLKTGQKVAVKVQRPFVKEKMLSDIKILKKLVPLANLTITKNVIDIKKAIDELSSAVEKELDFTEEMKNIIRFSQNNRDVKFITCPKVYERYSTEKILVMDYISGIKIDDINKLKKQGYDTQDIAIKITYNYFKQVFEDGFFHADPHPGNILIHNNTIGYIDFGLMGQLEPKLIKKLKNILEGVATNNVTLMMNSLISLGVKKGNINKDNLYHDIEKFYNNYANESIQDYDLHSIINEIIEIAKRNNIVMPHNILLLAKAIVTIQAVLAKLDDNITIMDVAIPYFRDKMISEKLKSLDFSQVATSIYYSLKSTAEIPNKFLEFLNSGIDGRLKFYLDIKHTNEIFNSINKMVNRLIISIIVAGLLVSSSLVINANTGLKIYGISAIGILGYLSATLAGLILIISIFKSGKL